MITNEIALSQSARTLINRKVRKLAGYGLFPDMDWAALRQELMLRLLSGLRGYNPLRPAEPFISTVIERSAAALIRERMAEKRNVAPASLDVLEELPESSATEKKTDLGIDLAEMIAALPPDLRAVAELLMSTSTTSEAARARGVQRSSFVRQVERLRRHLEDAGLTDYVS